MNQETDTNFGWWTEKPDRPTTQSALLHSRSASLDHRTNGRVWKTAALVVALMFALLISLIRFF